MRIKIPDPILSFACEVDLDAAVFIFGHGIPNRHNKSYSDMQSSYGTRKTQPGSKNHRAVENPRPNPAHAVCLGCSGPFRRSGVFISAMAGTTDAGDG